MRKPTDAEWAEYLQGGEPDLYDELLHLKYGIFWRIVRQWKRITRHMIETGGGEY